MSGPRLAQRAHHVRGGADKVRLPISSRRNEVGARLLKLMAHRATICAHVRMTIVSWFVHNYGRGIST